MTHHIYSTQAIILQNGVWGESNRTFSFLTKDFGLVSASAQGVREIRSKLRYSLKNFSHVQVSLVRGKEMWRVVTVIPEESFNGMLNDYNKIIIFTRISKLLLRLVAGESHNEELFDFLLTLAQFLNTQELDEQLLQSVELLAELKIISLLGYAKESPALNVYFYSAPLEKSTLKSFVACWKEARENVDYALRESHL